MHIYRRFVLVSIRISALMVVLVASLILMLAIYSVAVGNGVYDWPAIPLLILLIFWLLVRGRRQLSVCGHCHIPRIPALEMGVDRGAGHLIGDRCRRRPGHPPFQVIS